METTTNRTELLERLARLRALSNDSGATAGEAAAAQAAVTRLLLRYNLSLSDIPEDTAEGEPFVKDDTWMATGSRDDYAWQGTLLAVLGKYHFCKPIRTKPGAFTVVGKPSNVAALRGLYDSITRDLFFQGERARKDGRYSPLGVRRYRGSFMMGAVVRIGERFAEQRRSDLNEIPNGNALVVQTQRDLDAAFGDFFPHARAGRRRSVNSSAFGAGKVAGNNVKLQDSVRNTRTALTGRLALGA